jgi:hypothetical protein
VPRLERLNNLRSAATERFEMLKTGEMQQGVAKELGVQRMAAYQGWRAYRQAGKNGVRRRPIPAASRG